MRILFLRSELNLYGVSKTLFNLAEGLRNRGHNVIFASDNRDIFEKRMEKIGVRHYQLSLRPDRKNILSFLTCLIKMANIVKSEKVDIIHSHHRWSSFIACFISSAFRVPLVTTYHGIHQGKKMLSLWGDKVVAVSEDGKRHLSEYFNVKPERITVIHNGIKIPDLQNIDMPLEKNSFKQARQPTIANIARLSPEKDQESLFLAMKIVLKDHPQTRLLMVGKGPLENKLRMLSGKLGIAENVDFVGEVEDISQILKSIDFLILPSLTEGFPISILEAFAFSKPVIATNVGDIPAVVLDGKTGCLVPPKDPERLASAMSFLLSNRSLALKMGQNGRELVREKFSVDRMVLETEKVYLNLLSR